MSVAGSEHWMALEGGADGSPGARSYTSRFAAIGASLPERRLSTDELMARCEPSAELCGRGPVAPVTNDPVAVAQESATISD